MFEFAFQMNSEKMKGRFYVNQEKILSQVSKSAANVVIYFVFRIFPIPNELLINEVFKFCKPVV